MAEIKEASKIPTACTQIESCVVCAPLTKVWGAFRGFAFEKVRFIKLERREIVVLFFHWMTHLEPDCLLLHRKDRSQPSYCHVSPAIYIFFWGKSSWWCWWSAWIRWTRNTCRELIKKMFCFFVVHLSLGRKARLVASSRLPTRTTPSGPFASRNSVNATTPWGTSSCRQNLPTMPRVCKEKSSSWPSRRKAARLFPGRLSFRTM